MCNNLLFRLHNAEIFSVLLVDRGDLYPSLSSWWAEYEYPYLLFIPNPLFFSHYSGISFRGSADDIRLIISKAIFEFAVLGGVWLLLYAAERAVPD